MLKFIKSIYFHQRFYLYLTGLSALLLLSFWIPILFTIAQIVSLSLILLLLFDFILLYRFKEGVAVERVLADKLSNSDENKVILAYQNHYPFKVFLKVIDELPFQFQERRFFKRLTINAGKKKQVIYTVRPVERGVYQFGVVNTFVSTSIKMVSRRYKLASNQEVAVYPSYIQMKKYEFLALHNRLTEYGLKKIRRIGHTMEFEQIKSYVVGDDVRTINWKATAKKASLMVNQYQDEKSQPIYSLIDIGRVMKMPFEELKLIDYAINATLAFSNIGLKKNDKVGMLTFSNKVENIVPASNKKTNLSLINEVLYNIDTDFADSSFSKLYGVVQRKITHRSLLILYTNFEHISALVRQLPYLRSLAKRHLLVTVFFENTELNELQEENAENLLGIYEKTIAQKFAYEKKLIVKELERNGVHAILTKPEHLTVQVINKYLEFKAKGMI